MAPRALPALGTLALVGTLAGCGASDDAATPAVAGLEQSWISTVVTDPATFSAVVDPAKDGWIALHGNDWPAAVAAGGEPARRANLELAALHAVLADTSDAAWLALGSSWDKRGGPPADSAFAHLLAMAAEDAAAPTAAAPADAPRGAAAPGATAAVPVPEALTARRALHLGLRGGADDLAPLLSAAREPLLRETATVAVAATGTAGAAAPTVVRAFHDPWVHRTLAGVYSRRAAGAAPTDAVAASLFSGDLGGPDALTRLGVAFPTGADDTERCREAVRALDTKLDAFKVQLVANASPDGRALLDDLRLVEGARARLLVAQGAAALKADQPQCALAYAELARDHQDPRAVTPINSPTLYAVLAAANLQTGHTREALDALEVLVAPFPEVVGLDETVGDLAVLQGLDRAGDSREN